MKKIITTILALAMVSAMSVTAFAATEIKQDTPNQKGDTTIQTSIDPTYTVTIPASVNIFFGEARTDAGDITLTKAQIQPGYAVTVTAAAGALENSLDSSKTIPYVLNITGATANAVAFDTAGQHADMAIEVAENDWNSAFAGSYSGTVQFTIAYGAKTTA